MPAKIDGRNVLKCLPIITCLSTDGQFVTAKNYPDCKKSVAQLKITLDFWTSLSKIILNLF